MGLLLHNVRRVHEKEKKFGCRNEFHKIFHMAQLRVVEMSFSSFSPRNIVCFTIRLIANCLNEELPNNFSAWKCSHTDFRTRFYSTGDSSRISMQSDLSQKLRRQFLNSAQIPPQGASLTIQYRHHVCWFNRLHFFRVQNLKC